ncbi:hypothetical protein E3N88_04477 [Mikania micrantha]|uniref:10 kDa chaperonin n=1 Tax=Mikania micrantha TaxID=192012 RepID=A0A5N6PUH9_9ASTR|nr:hypothetical protein E3N88_04477 [Mikania micrantha]
MELNGRTEEATRCSNCDWNNRRLEIAEFGTTISVEAKSAGGVLLPKSAVKFERYLMGEILAVGTEVGDLEAGKKVLFSDVNAYEVDLGAEGRHCFCKASDLLALVE